MSQNNLRINELKNRAVTVRDEREEKQNSATRVGLLLYDMIQYSSDQTDTVANILSQIDDIIEGGGGGGGSAGVQRTFFLNVSQGITPTLPLLSEYNSQTGVFNHDGLIWRSTNVNPLEGEVVWMLWSWFSGNTPQTVDGPIKVNSGGGTGSNGEDANETEWIYMQQSSKLDSLAYNNWVLILQNAKGSALDKNGNPYTQADAVPANWEDNPKGVDSTNKYEYAAYRTSTINSNGKRIWGSTGFNAPILWSAYGDKGIDGDGMEYIFYADTDSNPDWYPVGKPNYPPDWNNNTAGKDGKTFLQNEFIAANSDWQDDPIDLSASGYGQGSIQWVSTRKKQEGVWQLFSIPAVWSRLGKDGVVDGYTIDLSNENMPVGTDTEGNASNYSNSTLVQAFYNGTPLIYEDTSSTPTSGHFTYSTGTITRSDGHTGTDVTNISASKNGATINVTINTDGITEFDEVNAYVPVTITLPNGTTRDARITLFGVATGEAGQAIDLYTSCNVIRTNAGKTEVIPSTLDIGVKIGRGSDVHTYLSGTASDNAESKGFSFKYAYDTDSSLTQRGSISLSANHSSITVLMYKNDILIDSETLPYVADGSIGTSVIAQYSPDRNTIHSTWQSGDIYMRTKSTTDSDWSPWHKIVGETGGETDYKFNISKYAVSESASTAPAECAYPVWLDAPMAPTSTHPYVWARIAEKTWDASIELYVEILASIRYVRLTGEKGEKGDTGQSALTLELDTYNLIFPSTAPILMPSTGTTTYEVLDDITFSIGVRMYAGSSQEPESLTNITAVISDTDLGDLDITIPVGYSNGINVLFEKGETYRSGNYITVTATCAKGSRSAKLYVIPSAQGENGTLTTYELRLDTSTVHYTVDYAGVRAYTPKKYTLSLYKTVDGVTLKLNSIPSGIYLHYIKSTEGSSYTASLGLHTTSADFGTNSTIPSYIDYVLYQGSVSTNTEMQRVRISSIRDYLRMLIPAGEYNGTKFNRTDTTTPLVLYNGKYYYLKADTNLINGINVAPSSSSGNPWGQANDFNVVLTKMLFAEFAHLGSFVVYNNYFISQYGTLKRSDGTEIIINESRVNSNYTAETPIELRGNGESGARIICKITFTSKGSANITLATSSEQGYTIGAVGKKNVDIDLDDSISTTNTLLYIEGGTNTDTYSISVLSGSFVYAVYEKDDPAVVVGEDKAVITITGVSYEVTDILTNNASKMTCIAGSKTSVPYGWFDPTDPMAENVLLGYKFRPTKCVNALTGEEWMAEGKVHVSLKGDLTILNATIQGSMMYRKVVVTSPSASVGGFLMFTGSTADTLALKGDTLILQGNYGSNFNLYLPPAKFFIGASIKIINATYISLNPYLTPDPSVITLNVYHSSATEEAIEIDGYKIGNNLAITCPMENYNVGSGHIFFYDSYSTITYLNYQTVELVAMRNPYYSASLLYVWAVIDARYRDDKLSKL